jgi:MATE family multidrug resistance protein
MALPPGPRSAIAPAPSGAETAMHHRSQLVREARRTAALALPIIVGQVGNVLMGVVDTVMIGQVGRVPLAASAFANNILVIFLVAGFGVLSAISVLVARASGARRPDECGELLRHGAAAGFASALVMGMIMSLCLPWLGMFRQPPEVMAAARPYLAIIAWTIVPVMLFHAFKQYCEGLSAPVAPMVITLGSVVLNGFLNWVLIYGKLGAPALGLVGAGWATLAARIAALVALGVYVAAAPRFAGWRPRRWRAPLRWQRLREMFAVGLPIGLQVLFEVGVFSAAGFMVGWIGTVPLAAHQIAISCVSMTFMIPLGLSFAAGVRIGQAAGAGEHERLRVIGHGALGVAWLFMGTCAVVFLVAGEWIARGFVHDAVTEAPVIAVATQLLIVAGLFQLFDGTQVVSIGSLRGIMDVRVPTVVTFVAYWLVALPAGYVGAFVLGWGPIGVWIGLASGLATSAIMLAVRFEWLTRPGRIPATT